MVFFKAQTISHMRYLIILLFLYSYTLSAQTSQGSFLVGGNVLLDYSETSTDNNGNQRELSIGLTPKVGFFVTNKLCLGTAINLSFSKIKYTDVIGGDYDLDGKSSGVGPFIRYYFPINKLFIITEASYTFNKIKSEVRFFDEASGTNFYIYKDELTKEFTLSSGLGIFLSQNTSLEFLLSYRNTDYHSEYENGYILSDSKRNSLYLSIGFQIYIPRKTNQQ